MNVKRVFAKARHPDRQQLSAFQNAQLPPPQKRRHAPNCSLGIRDLLYLWSSWLSGHGRVYDELPLTIYEDANDRNFDELYRAEADAAATGFRQRAAGLVFSVILVCGEALVDLIVEHHEDANAYDAAVSLLGSPGGSPYNVAIGCSQLGFDAGLSAPVGTDRLGRLLREKLSRSGVRPAFLSASVDPTPVAIVDISDPTSPQYAFHGLVGLSFSPDEKLGAWTLVRSLHVGSMALVAERSSGDLADLFTRCSGRKLLSVDPNVRLSMEPSVARWRVQVERFCGLADLVKVSEEDITALYGEDANTRQIASSFLRGSCRLVALTRGARGATFFSRRHGSLDVPPGKVEVVDTVGAGDAFQAALLCWLTSAGHDSGEGVDALTIDQLRALGTFCTATAAAACAQTGPGFAVKGLLEGLR